MPPPATTAPGGVCTRTPGAVCEQARREEVARCEAVRRLPSAGQPARWADLRTLTARVSGAAESGPIVLMVVRELNA